MTEKETEFFPDGEPQELRNWESVAPKAKTFLRKISAIAGLTAVAQLIGLTLPNPAQAGDGRKFNLSPDTPAEQLVEWQGASSPNLATEANYTIRGRILKIATTANAPVFLHGACPPEDLYPGWKLDNPGADKTGGKDAKKEGGTEKKQGYEAEVHEMDIVRTGPNGTWTVATTAPSRLGQTLQTTLTCKKGEDSQKLTAFITSQGDGGSSGAGNYFTFSGEGAGSSDDSTSADENPVWHARGAVADTIPMSGIGDTNNLGVLAAIGVDPVHGGGSRNFEIDLVYRSGRVPGEVTDEAGKKHVVDGYTHCGFVSGGWTPELGTELVRGRVAGAIGVCAAEALETDYGRVDGKTSVGVGRGDAGIEVGGKNIGITGGVDAVVGADSSSRFWGPYAGIYGRW